MNKLQKPLALLALGAASIAMIACSGVSATGESGSPDDLNSEPTVTSPTDGRVDAPGNAVDLPGYVSPDTPVGSGNGSSVPKEHEGQSGGGSTGVPQDYDYERAEVEAPIEDFGVVSRDTAPPTYVLHITSGLPSGCAAFERIDVGRDGNTINVSVINTMPAPDVMVACTMIYGWMEHEVELEEIESGVEYTVIVNGESITFTAE